MQPVRHGVVIAQVEPPADVTGIVAEIQQGATSPDARRSSPGSKCTIKKIVTR